MGRRPGRVADIGPVLAGNAAARTSTRYRDGVHLLSWNLKGNDSLLKRALRHVAAHSPAVASLQEVPHPFDAAWLAAQGFPPDLRVLARSEDRQFRRHLAVVASGPIRAERPRRDPEAKWLMITAMLPDIGLTDITAIHAISRFTEDNQDDRLDRAARLRRSINGFRMVRQAIMMGDFNADPFEREMWNKEHIYALRERARVEDLCAQDVDWRHHPWWNPCWQLLGESAGQALNLGGTHWYARKLRHSHWYLFDQILLSAPLIPRLRAVRIESNVGGALLNGPHVDPGAISIGDHLPVSATLS